MMTREGMMKTGNKRIHPGGGAAAVLAVILMLAGALPGFAQTAGGGEPQDLVFEITNATTGESGSVERMTIDYLTVRRNNVADFEPSGSVFTARAVPVKESGKYIVTVWSQGVPYWWEKRGRELVAGPVTLNVFDVSPNLEGVSFSGLNLIVRRQESLVRLEYMLQILNVAKPQVTVMGGRQTFELALPSGTSEIEATYTRGPDPTPVTIHFSGNHSGVVVPLTPGPNQIRIQAIVPWSEGLEIPVGSDIPVSAWSVLASPEWLEVGSTDMEENDSEKVPGFRRFAGFPLDAGEVVTLRLNSGQQVAGAEDELFTKEAPAQKDDGGQDKMGEKKGGMLLPLIFVGVLIIVVIAAAVRRRT
jgi:hypothetical protein